MSSAFMNRSALGRSVAIAVLSIVAVACGSAQPTASPAASPAPTAQPTVGPTATPAPPTQPPATPVPPTDKPTASPTVEPSPSPAGATLLLDVTTEGGFIAPTARLGQLPDVVVDTAGNIYTADPNETGNPLVPTAVVRNVGPGGAAQILAAMRAAGLDKANDNGGVPGDTGVSVFTAEIDGQEIVNRIVANGGGPGHPGASGNPAIDLLTRLTDPSEAWGATDVTTTDYTPVAYKVYAAPTTNAGSPTIDWPLDTSLAQFGTPATPDYGVTGLRSGVVFGDDAGPLADATSGATAETLVMSDGQLYQVWIRPLLPTELGQ